MGHLQIELQNKLYHHLLFVERKKNPDIFLKRLLKIFVSITNAKQGYIELKDEHNNIICAEDSFNSKQIKNIRNTISKGIIFEVLKKRKIVQTYSAVTDPRFGSRKSVQSAKIESVLCVPIHTDKVAGVLYLQGDSGFRVDSEEHIRDAKLIVNQIVPLVEKIYQDKLSQNLEDIDYLKKKYDTNGIIGDSKALKEVLKTSIMVAPLNISILITGETGTGKTQIAKVIHQNSLRKDKPFVELNCAALPETLIENELFGSLKGGHSSATSPILGKIAAANGGTLFLDEIGELPITVQAKLLQLLQSGFYYPLGSSEPLKADLRIITATNINLEQAIIQKKFREDLYYRINVFSIHLPSLFERKSDIEILSSFFCKESCKKHDFPEVEISKHVLNIFYRKKWNGNIRELEHTIESAIVKAIIEGKKKVLINHLPLSSYSDKSDIKSGFKEATLLFQKKYLKQNLEAQNWNISKTAKDIDISRSQLNNLIKSFHLVRNSIEKEKVL
ncbi:MAG: AAA domain-containing protein [Desulfobacterales bacterium]|nr:AAA domain-containing protein [Desulfobacterales bacterium]MCP4162102.1 AAA domain-containing protein [Deltaproteobacteria bacterium]